MDDLTVIIPAKNEKESLPHVLNELKKYNLKTIIVLEESDTDTINSLKNFSCKILFQKNKGYGDALIQGINYVQTKFFCIFNASEQGYKNFDSLCFCITGIKLTKLCSPVNIFLFL